MAAVARDEAVLGDAREVIRGDSVNSPCRANSSVNSWRTRAPSRCSRSKMKRSKFDAFEMSIDGLDVSKVSAALRTR